MKENNICDLCVSYVAEELSSDQKKIFNDHLQHCTSCRAEAAELGEAWSLLPMTVDEVEIPSSLKEETMQFVFSPSSSTSKPKHNQPRLWMVRWTAAAAIVVMIAAIFNITLQLRNQNDEQDLLFMPASIVELYTLSAVDSESSDGRGTACIVQQGDKNQLIIYSWGLQATQMDEVYQVWYSHEGVQYNAGTFKVDDYGYGVLTFDLDQAINSIDMIGITLELDGTGNEPRGKKVLGT